MMTAIFTLIALAIILPVAFKLLCVAWWLTQWLVSIPLLLIVSPAMWVLGAKEESDRLSSWVDGWFKITPEEQAKRDAAQAIEKAQRDQFFMMTAVASMAADKIAQAQQQGRK